MGRRSRVFLIRLREIRVYQLRVHRSGGGGGAACRVWRHRILMQLILVPLQDPYWQGRVRGNKTGLGSDPIDISRTIAVSSLSFFPVPGARSCVQICLSCQTE